MSKLIQDLYINGYCTKCTRCLSGYLCPFKAGIQSGMCSSVKECDSFEQRSGKDQIDEVSS